MCHPDIGFRGVKKAIEGSIHVASPSGVDVCEGLGSIGVPSWPPLWLASHSCLAIGIGAICMFAHQAFSLPCRCKSWWWGRRSGTVNSSLTLRPKALGWANFRCGSDGVCWQIRQGCASSRMNFFSPALAISWSWWTERVRNYVAASSAQRLDEAMSTT
jgi:hypothetical protein